MKNSGLIEIILSAAVVILAVILVNPAGFWMPNMVTISLVLLLVVVFAVFAGFIWKEQTRDEREVLHRMMAGRIGYLFGAAALVVAIVVEGFAHRVDPWLVIALTAATMILLDRVYGLDRVLVGKQ